MKAWRARQPVMTGRILIKKRGLVSRVGRYFRLHRQADAEGVRASRPNDCYQVVKKRFPKQVSFHPEIIQVVACCFGNWERPPDEKRAGGFFSFAYLRQRLF